MERLKKHWKRTPRRVRRPLVLVIGTFFVLLSGALGWLPGPGGIPLFLIGIAILASEFTWAERVRDRILGYVYQFGDFMRRQPLAAWSIIILGILCSASLLYLIVLYR